MTGLRFRFPTQRPAVARERADNDPAKLRELLRKIAADDREAFAELFALCSAELLFALRQKIADPHHLVAVFAGTFVEVWWLAGCHVGDQVDVIGWISNIAGRRTDDRRPPVVDASGRAVLPAEVELAGLLRRRDTPSATAQAAENQERQRYEEHAKLMGFQPGDNPVPPHQGPGPHHGLPPKNTSAP